MTRDHQLQSKALLLVVAIGLGSAALVCLFRRATTSAEPAVAVFAAVAAFEFVGMAAGRNAVQRWAFYAAATAGLIISVKNGGAYLATHLRQYALAEGALLGFAALLLIFAAARQQIEKPQEK